MASKVKPVNVPLPKNIFDLGQADRQSVIEKIEQGLIKSLATDLLTPFYVCIVAVKQRIAKLETALRPEILSRFDEGVAYGATSQHRRFEYSGTVLKIETRKSPTINVAKAIDVLKRHRLSNVATDLVPADADSALALQEYLKKHKGELEILGMKFNRNLSESKLKGLVETGKLTEAEAKEFAGADVTTHAFLTEVKVTGNTEVDDQVSDRELVLA